MLSMPRVSCREVAGTEQLEDQAGGGYGHTGVSCTRKSVVERSGCCKGRWTCLGRGILEFGQRQSEPQWPWAAATTCGGPLGMGALRISASSQGRASGTREPPRAAPANTGSLAPSYITWVPMGQVGDSPDTQPPNPQPPHTSAPHPSRPRKRPAQTLEADFGLLARNLQKS